MHADTRERTRRWPKWLRRKLPRQRVILEFGSKKCVCPKCGAEVPHAFRGVPCSKTKCPKCGSQMEGTQCSE